MNLPKFYWRSWLIPSLLILIGNIVYIVYENNWGAGKNYKSEWLDNETINIVVIQTVILNALLFAVLMSPMFLMKFSAIQKHILPQFLAWFALPVGWALIVCYKIKLYEKVNSNNLWVATMTLPYIISIIISFIYWKKKTLVETRVVPI